MSYDWTRFKRQVFIDSDPKTVFNAWAVPNELIRWFIARAEVTSVDGRRRDGRDPVAVGDRYHWRWHQDLEAQGTVHEVDPGRKLTFSFGRVEGAADDVLVSIEVSPHDDGRTVLTLTQEQMPPTPAGHRYHLSCNLGWSFFMTNLKGLLEHGIDLRETDTELAMASRAMSLE